MSASVFNQKQFKKELKELLHEHNVHIVFSVSECSDTYGLYDEKMVVYDRVGNKSHLLAHGCVVDESDL